MLSNTFNTSTRSSKFTRPPIGNRLVTPMSKRVKNGARTSSVRGAQSPALSWMQSALLAGAK